MEKITSFALTLMAVASVSHAQTWTKKRAAFPPATDITGRYTPVQATPGFDGQETMFYLPLEQKICGMLPDKSYTGGEWSNAMFCYDPDPTTGDDGIASSGQHTGWTLLWESLNNALNAQAGLVGTSQIAGLACYAGSPNYVTVTAPVNSAKFLAPGRSLLTASMPTGISNGLFRVASHNLGTPVGTWGNLYNVFSWDDPGCTPGTYTVTANSMIAVNDELSDTPSRRHFSAITPDTSGNIWMGNGVADLNLDATTINGGHSGLVDLYKMTKTVDSGSHWGWSEICGYGESVAGTGVSSPWTLAGGPGQLCGQETITPTTTGPQVGGFPCTDSPISVGGTSSGGNNSSCGYKFSYLAYDPTNSVLVNFGGQWNSSTRCETLLYYPSNGVAGNVFKNPYDPNAGCGTTYPETRWNTAGTRLVPIGGGKLMLFGGNRGADFTGGQIYSTTWIFQTCPSDNLAGCKWIKVNSIANPPATVNPVIDYDSAINKVVLITCGSTNGLTCDGQTGGAVPHSHVWFFDPATLQWSDQGMGGGAELPSLVVGINCDSGLGTNCITMPYNTTGGYDAKTNQMVLFNRVGLTTNPPASSTVTQIWTLDLPPATADTNPPAKPQGLALE